MASETSLQQVAHLIQLAAAPIFLLTAVAATLSVFAGRLSRIVDRGRNLERTAHHEDAAVAAELITLQARARLIYWALTLGVLAALLVTALMGLAFAGAALGFSSAKAVGFLFLAALTAYTGALLCLLREVFLALGSFRLGLRAP